MIKHTQLPEGNRGLKTIPNMGPHAWVYRRFCENHSSWSVSSPTSCHSKPGKSNRESTTLETEIDTVNYFLKKKDQNRPQQNGWKLAEETIHSDLFVMPLVNRKVPGQKTPRFETPPGVFAGFPPPIWPFTGESGSQKDSQQV